MVQENDEITMKRLELNKAVKRIRNRELYAKRRDDKVLCSVCSCKMDKYNMAKHLETTKHKKRVAIVEQMEREKNLK